jgi:hemoglobin
MKPIHIMKKLISTVLAVYRRTRGRTVHLLLLGLALIVLGGSVGCGSKKVVQKEQDFFTSGSRDADQRASQRMARNEQLTGSGEGSAEKGVKKAKAGDSGTNNATGSSTNNGVRVEGKMALFDRLGGEPGLSNIVADFMPRALQDPRVNWQRKGVKGAWFQRKGRESGMWQATPENMAKLSKHFVQFLALATGGPAQYGGKEMKSAHGGMKISNPEFDAVVGDLKASLDKLQIPNKEQKELIAIIESTRSQIVTER